MKPSIQYGIQENLAKKMILIDGITRCGKSLLTNIIPSLKGVEHIQFFVPLENLVPGLRLGAIDPSYAKTYLRVLLNELVYNIKLARGVNFRYQDQSGVLNYKEPQIYYQRLSRQEGDDAVLDLCQGPPFVPFQTHDLLALLEHLEKLDLDYQMVALFRHPVDNIYSWYTRGWGERFGQDPRAFTLTLQYQDKLLPWYCYGKEEEWLLAHPMERCILSAGFLIEESVSQYLNFNSKEKIHVLTFEAFAENPFEEIKKIADFLGTEMTVHTPRFVQAARCPRVLVPEDRKRKLEAFRAGVRPEYFEKLVVLSEAFESQLYGILEPCKSER